MKSLQKRRSQEEVEKRKLNKLKLDQYDTKWIGLMVYPFFMLFSFWVNAQSLFDTFTELDFEKTRAKIDAISEKNFELIYIDHLNDCAEIILNDNQATFEDFEERYELRLDQIEALPNGPQKGFLAAEVRLQWAFLLGKQGRNWSAFWTLRRSLSKIKDNIEAYPEFPFNNRTMGLLNVVLDMVPQNRQWLLDVFGMKGDFEKGYAQLAQTEGFNEDWKRSSAIILALIDSYVLEKETDLNTLPERALYDYVNGLVYNKQHSAKQAIKKFERLDEQLYTKSYLLAESYFNAGYFRKSLEQYQHFLLNTNVINYRKDALLKSGLCVWFLEENLSNAQPYFQQARAIDHFNTEIDRNAHQILQEIEEQNPHILKLRYALDGGSFDQASRWIQVLEREDLTGYQQFELSYRKARFYQLTGDLNQATQIFNEVVEVETPYEENYFVPNAYLQLGKIYETQGDTSKAILHYQRVIQVEDHPYKQSLDLKARLAINRLVHQDD